MVTNGRTFPTRTTVPRMVTNFPIDRGVNQVIICLNASGTNIAGLEILERCDWDVVVHADLHQRNRRLVRGGKHAIWNNKPIIGLIQHCSMANRDVRAQPCFRASCCRTTPDKQLKKVHGSEDSAQPGERQARDTVTWTLDGPAVQQQSLGLSSQ